MKDLNITKGKLMVRVSEDYPFPIETYDEEGNVVFVTNFPTSSSSWKSLKDVLNAKGWDWDEMSKDDVAKANQKALANEVLRASAPELLKNLIRCVDRLEENGMGEMMAVKKAKEEIEKATKKYA